MNIGGYPLRSVKDSFGGPMSCSSMIEATFMLAPSRVNLIIRYDRLTSIM